MSAQTALITGASAGIGRALAIEFARGGYDVILTARRKQLLGELAREIEEDYSVKATVIPCDLIADGSVRKLHETIEAGGLDVDVLVNNAAFGIFGEFSATDLERQKDLLALNIRVLTELCYVFLPGMLQRDCGGILNVGSIASFQAGPRFATYYASKAYVLSLSEALDTELRGTSVTVTCLAPGPTHSEFAQVAGLGTGGLFNVLAQSSEVVAGVGYRAFKRGRALVISGWVNKVSVFMMRFLPRKLVRWVTAKVVGVRR